MDHLASTVLVLAAALLVAFMVIVAFTRYDLVGPIRRLCDMAEGLASGQIRYQGAGYENQGTGDTRQHPV